MVGGRGRKRGRGYIGGGIHSAENHRGTFRGAPVREETREKERDEGKKARELVASMKLKQKNVGKHIVSLGTDRYTRPRSSHLSSFPLTFAFILSLSPLFFSVTGLTEPYVPLSIRPCTQTCSFSRWAEFFFFFSSSFFLFFFLSFITRRRTRSTVEITRRRLLGYFFEWRRLVSIVHRI